jgi:hypothetical protein
VKASAAAAFAGVAAEVSSPPTPRSCFSTFTFTFTFPLINFDMSAIAANSTGCLSKP